MTSKVSIILPVFRRPKLLLWNLVSLARQEISFEHEIIVLNDGVYDQTEAICRHFGRHLRIRYVFTGQRNLGGKLRWRSPGFAINIGARLSESCILIICDAEIFHLNNSIEEISVPLLSGGRLLGIPSGKKDVEGVFLQYLIENHGKVNEDMPYEELPRLNVQFPFLMSLPRKEFFSIGGYDEEFTGIAAEDNDFVERLLLNGCEYYKTNARVVHLYHPTDYGTLEQERRDYNYKLYKQKKGTIVRNQGKVWGFI